MTRARPEPRAPAASSPSGIGPVLEARSIGKRFGGTVALRDIDLAFAPGEVHALVGENGAGKSTFARILAGALKPDAGELRLNGSVLRTHSPRDAHLAGIAMVAQELAIAPTLTVVDNVFLGIETSLPRRRKTRAKHATFERICQAAGFDLPADAAAGSLRLADQQKLEILRILARDARFLILDEPTAALNAVEIEQLVKVVRRLAADRRTVIFVSHHLDEVLEIADRVSIFKDGSLVRTAPAATETADSLIESMLGRRMAQAFPAKRIRPAGGATVLDVDDLQVASDAPGISLSVGAGEIVCIAGLAGSGRSELVRAIFGADPALRGRVRVAGSDVAPRSPGDALRAGIAFIPESRKTQGLLLNRSSLENVSLASLRSFARAGVIDAASLARGTNDAIRGVDVRGRLEGPVFDLSGGNQQKLLFARSLLGKPRVLIADEPTRGVDVGAKRAIYDLITGLAEQGMGVLLVSSELEEVLGLAHRVLVMSRGSVVAELPADASGEAVMAAAFSGGPKGRG